MSIDRTLQLKTLRLYGMAAAWGEWWQVRSLNYRAQGGSLPHRDLLQIEWSKPTP